MSASLTRPNLRKCEFLEVPRRGHSGEEVSWFEENGKSTG